MSSKKNRSTKKSSGPSPSADSTPGRNSPALPTATRYESYDETKSSHNPSYENGYDVNDSAGDRRSDEYKKHSSSK